VGGFSCGVSWSSLVAPFPLCLLSDPVERVLCNMSPSWVQPLARGIVNVGFPSRVGSYDYVSGGL
jgi:hypothetical protein